MSPFSIAWVQLKIDETIIFITKPIDKSYEIIKTHLHFPLLTLKPTKILLINHFNCLFLKPLEHIPISFRLKNTSLPLLFFIPLRTSMVHSSGQKSLSSRRFEVDHVAHDNGRQTHMIDWFNKRLIIYFDIQFNHSLGCILRGLCILSQNVNL